MEFAFRSQPTPAAADDEENGRLRRFPDPPPPQPHGHGDANAPQVDAALRTRREELLWELHKERIRQDMILRELVETERAMGLTAGGHNPVPALPWSQDYWCSRTPSMPPWVVPLHQPCHCCCGSSTGVRAPPLYPLVERSPSPVPLLQPQSASDAEKQQECRSSGLRMHPTSRHVGLCTSPSNWPPQEETLVPVACNASVRSMRSGSTHEEVASTHQRTDDSWEHKVGAEACHGVQHTYEGRNQKSEEREAAKFAMGDQIDEAMQRPSLYSLASNENAGPYQQKRLEFSEPAPEQARPGNDVEQHQEGRLSVLRTHPLNGFVELCRSPSKQIPVEETLVPVAAKADIYQTQSASFCREAASGHQQAAVGVKVDVADGHSMQPLHEIKNQSSEEQKAIDSAIEDCIKIPVQQRLQYKPADHVNVANSEQKGAEFNEPTHERTSAGVKRRLTAPSSPVKKQKPLGQWSCSICQSNPVSQRQLEEHLAGKRHQSNVAALLQTSRSSSPEPEPELDMKATLARSWAITATNAHQNGDEEVSENRWTCTLCRAKCTSESDYYIHLGGRRHRENIEARRSSSPDSEPDTKATPARNWGIAATNSRQDGEEEVSENRWTCTLCRAKCTRELDYYIHLAGRRHRENIEARRAEQSRFYCSVCDLQCNSDKMLESHFGGRKHREKLEQRD